MKRLDSWDILLMFYRHWRAFIIIFVVVLVIGFGLFYLSLKNADSDIESKVESKVESILDSKKTFSVDIISKSIKNTPIITKYLLDSALQDYKVVAKQNNIFEVSFAAEDSIEAGNLVNEMKLNIANNAMIKATLNNLNELESQMERIIKNTKDLNIDIKELAEIKSARDNTISFGEIRELTPKEAKEANVKDKDEVKDFVQTSKRAKIILIFLSALIISCMGVYIIDFIQSNKERFKRA